MSNIVISGANRGIGLELTRHYLSAGHEVFALCRQSSRELNESGAVVIENIDVQDVNLAEHLGTSVLAGKPIDILINNAGILQRTSLDNMDYDSMMQQFQVNALGPLRITQALRTQLGSGSKIALITSRMGSVTDNTSGGHYGYRMSKAALNIAGVSLAHDLQSQGVAVVLLHPGYVQTAMVSYGGDISATVAAERLARRIEELNLENSGSFWHSSGEPLPW